MERDATGLVTSARSVQCASQLTFRIDSETEGTTRVIRIAGRLDTEGGSELEVLARGAEGQVVLDVASLDGVTEEGLAALRRLEAGGASLRGVQPYLALRLREGRGDSD